MYETFMVPEDRQQDLPPVELRLSLLDLAAGHRPDALPALIGISRPCLIGCYESLQEVSPFLPRVEVFRY